MPIDNKKVHHKPLPHVLPKHPHRVLYILLFTLIFVLVAGALVMYQINKVSIVEYSSPPDENTIQVEGLKRLNEQINNNVTKEEELAGLKVLLEKNKRINK